MDSMKTCPRCKEQFPRAEWYIIPSTGKPVSYCKPCRSAVRKASRARGNNRIPQREAVQLYGGKCVCCGESEPLLLEIDHIHRNGTDDRKKWRNNLYRYYLNLVNNHPQPGYQVLCTSCNMAKYRHGLCPHNGGTFLG